MYKKISEISNGFLEKLKTYADDGMILFRDAEDADFKKIKYVEGKKPFTKENLTFEISKIATFPDYLLIPDKHGVINIVCLEKDPSSIENQQIKKIYKDVFGLKVI